MTQQQAKKTLRTLTEKMKKEFLEAGKPLVEQGVREEFLNPLIKQVWGYATADIDYEYYVKSANDYVDYRIKATEGMNFFTDAKRLNEDLNKHGAKMAQYLTVEDARWGVLCNGRELQVYDDNATGDAKAKKVLELSLVDYKNDDEFDHMFEQVWLLSKESMTHHRLGDYIDGLILTKHLQQVLQQPHELIVKAARQAVKKACGKDFKPQVVANAIKQMTNPASVVLPIVEEMSKKKRKKPKANEVQVAVLLAAKLLNVGQKIYAKYRGFNYEASVEADGNIMFNGVSHPSLSSAGSAAREDACLKLGETRQLQTNGWMFWRYEDEGGKRKPLSDLRAKLKTQ